MFTLRELCRLLSVLAGMAPALSFAQPSGLPDKPVRIIVPNAAAGPNDLVGRVIGPKLSETLGQNVIVENRPSANGVIGSEYVARAAADGTVLAVGNSGTHAVNATLYAKLPYDPVRDFVPVSTVGFSGLALLVNAASPARSVKELIATAKGRPDRFNIGVTFVGSTNHLAAELFKSMAGIDVQVVPFKTSPALITGVSGNESQAIIEFIPPVLPLVRSGALRALGVTSDRRSANMPDVPTLAEAGLPGFEASAWNGLAAPAKTPRAIVTQLNREVHAIVAIPAVKRRLRELDADARAGTSESFRDLLVADIAKWKRVVERANIERR